MKCFASKQAAYLFQSIYFLAFNFVLAFRCTLLIKMLFETEQNVIVFVFRLFGTVTHVLPWGK